MIDPSTSNNFSSAKGAGEKRRPAPDASTYGLQPTACSLGPVAALRDHWPEYLIEAWALGMFMISAGGVRDCWNRRVRRSLVQIARRGFASRSGRTRDGPHSDCTDLLAVGQTLGSAHESCDYARVPAARTYNADRRRVLHPRADARRRAWRAARALRLRRSLFTTARSYVATTPMRGRRASPSPPSR